MIKAGRFLWTEKKQMQSPLEMHFYVWMYLEENMRLSLNTARKDLKKHHLNSPGMDFVHSDLHQKTEKIRIDGEEAGNGKAPGRL